MGLPPDPGCLDEPRASRRPIHGRHDPAGSRYWPRSGAADVAHVLAAHWGAIAAADFFTTELWTVRGLVTYYTLFVIELESRRVHLVGSTAHPDDAFVLQVARVLTSADDGVLRGHRILICDRDTKWSAAFRQTLADVGIRVVQTPFQAPNCNAHAERFVRSIKEECLNRMIFVGQGALRRGVTGSSLIIIASATAKDCAIDLFSQSEGLWRRVRQFVGGSDSVAC